MMDEHGLQRALDSLHDKKGKRLALRIFVDGEAGKSPDAPIIIYARVKTSDLKSFLQHECNGVHR